MSLVKCLHCLMEFEKNNYEIKRTKNRNFCSRICFTNHNKKESEVICKNCNIKFNKCIREQKRTKNNFCSQSCAATYNNTHKKHGTKVSKLEKYIQEKLQESYDYDFHFNRKDTINSELDIYIPELKLAFELNGIFHYEPIFGEEKLNQIRNNDNRKFQACLEKQISLCIIDTSWIKNFKINNANKILEIINKIIYNKGSGGI